MRSGTKHSPQTIEKMRQTYARIRSTGNTVEGEDSSPVTETAVIAWLQGLEPKKFMQFMRDVCIPLIKKYKE